MFLHETIREEHNVTVVIDIGVSYTCMKNCMVHVNVFITHENEEAMKYVVLS